MRRSSPASAEALQLYRPSEHEALVDGAWHEGKVRDAVAAIVDEAEGACDGRFWPDHPRDEWPAFPPGPTTVYLGSAGMCWALHRLGSSLDVAAVLARAIEHYRERPDFAPDFGDEPSLWMGESGLLLVARIVGSAAADDGRLAARIHENCANPTWELMWGSPGTMEAARACGFDELWRESAELLWAAWDEETEKARVQWCHGAPGIVATVGDHLPRDLARGGGELAWEAGPIERGPGLCHGTAGNGYAFLKLFALTGDELWRERARRFAMHAIAQVDRERAALGRGRYTLRTGDVGVALYLQSCLDDDARVPTVDFW